VMMPKALPPRLGLNVKVPARAELVGLGAKSGLLVEQAIGPAARAKLIQGDLLVAAVRDAKRVALDNVQALDEAISVLEDGEALVLLVQRGTGRSYVSLESR